MTYNYSSNFESADYYLDGDDLVNYVNYNIDLEAATQNSIWEEMQKNQEATQAQSQTPQGNITPDGGFETPTGEPNIQNEQYQIVQCDTETAVQQNSQDLSNQVNVMQQVENMEIESSAYQQNLNIKIEEELNEIINAENENLRIMLENLMEGYTPSDQQLQELFDMEKNIFYLIQEKKYFTEDEKTTKGKRTEEKQKMFFKSALKFLGKKFFEKIMGGDSTKLDKKSKKNFDETEFYNYYFLDTARQLNLDIANFYQPNKTIKAMRGQQKRTPIQKSLNQTYIDLVLSSKAFREDAQSYLENFFVADYAKQRSKKINKLMTHVKKIISTKYNEVVQSVNADQTFAQPNDNETRHWIVQELKQQILNNSKLKLPWSNRELEEAQEFARVSITNSALKATKAA